MKVRANPNTINKLEDFLINHFHGNDVMKFEISCGEDKVSFDCFVENLETFSKEHQPFPWFTHMHKINFGLVEMLKVDLNKPLTTQ